MTSYIFDVIVLELDELIEKGMSFNHTNFHDSTSTCNWIVELVLDIIDGPLVRQNASLCGNGLTLYQTTKF